MYGNLCHFLAKSYHQQRHVTALLTENSWQSILPLATSDIIWRVESFMSTLTINLWLMSWIIFYDRTTIFTSDQAFSFIAEFTTVNRYVKGETNFVADALSRLTVSAIEYDAAINYKDLSNDQASDKEFIRLRHATSWNMEFRLLKTFDNVLVWCDILTGRSRPYVTEKFRRKVFNSLHGLGHPSHRATKPLIISHFVWHKMNSDIANWCRYCTRCQTAKVSRHNR